MPQDSLIDLKLRRMLELLREFNEPHWYSYFSEAARLLASGKLEHAKKKIRGAYGGMTSFSDALYFTGAPAEIAEEGFRLRGELYQLSQPQGLLGFLLRFGP